MTPKSQKRLSGTIACVCAVLFAALLSGPPEVAPNGTIPSNGIGGALEMLFVGTVFYMVSMLILSRICGQTEN